MKILIKRVLNNEYHVTLNSNTPITHLVNLSNEFDMNYIINKVTKEELFNFSFC